MFSWLEISKCFCLRSRPVSPDVVRVLVSQSVSDNVENDGDRMTGVTEWPSDRVTGSFTDDWPDGIFYNSVPPKYGKIVKPGQELPPTHCMMAHLIHDYHLPKYPYYESTSIMISFSDQYEGSRELWCSQQLATARSNDFQPTLVKYCTRGGAGDGKQRFSSSSLSGRNRRGQWLKHQIFYEI